MWPFHDGFSRLPSLTERNQVRLEELLRRCAEAGWTVQMHIIRPETTDLVIEMWSRIHADVPIDGLRWAIVHGESVEERHFGPLSAMGCGVVAEAILRFENMRVEPYELLGELDRGFKIAMRTLDIFRASVAAAALGFARRALDEAVTYSRQRAMFGKTLADFQLTQAAIAEMATAVDAAALLTYRAAWQRDTGQPVTKTAAMAKMTATESAQSVIDRAVQIFGGRGVVHGAVVERLYRDIRALRIYEGATEVQKLIIAREVLK